MNEIILSDKDFKDGVYCGKQDLTREAGMRIFAGVAPWSWVTKEHSEIKCGKLLKGEVAYGQLVEKGLEAEVPSLKGKEVEVVIDGKKHKAVIQ